MSRQARQAPQWSLARRVGRAAPASVRIAPRKSQEPNSRETRLVCLPCQPMPGGLGQRLFHQRRGVDEHLHLAAEARLDPAGQPLQPPLDQLVIVVALRVDRDRRVRARLQRRQRVAVRPVVQPQHDRRAGVRPHRASGARGARRCAPSSPSSPCRPAATNSRQPRRRPARARRRWRSRRRRSRAAAAAARIRSSARLRSRGRHSGRPARGPASGRPAAAGSTGATSASCTRSSPPATSRQGTSPK